MKTKELFSTGRMAWALAAVIALSFFTACSKSNDNNNNLAPYTINGSASGSQMVPAVSGSGSATMTGSFDPATRQFSYTANWSGLSGAPTSGGFYSGFSGVNGPAVGTPFTFPAGTTGTGSMSGTMELTPLQASEITSDGWYYSFGTASNPSGEVRGQMDAVQQ